MKDLIASLIDLNLNVNSKDLDQCVEILKNHLPFKIHEFPGGKEHNGWVVPKRWEVKEAKIFLNENVFFDGLKHPLGVIGYSQGFQGNVSKEELKKHLFFSDVFDDALIYHCDLFYKVAEKNWGFCVPKTIFDQMPDGPFKIDLQCSFSDGSMKVLDLLLKGEASDCIVINAHNCHPTLANDNLSGVAVGIELFKWLQKLPKRKLSYRLIIAPEHFGTIFFLQSLSTEAIKNFIAGFYLDSLGSKEILKLQKSFTGVHFIDRVAQKALVDSGLPFETGQFRTITGNDETVWEAPGIEVAFPTLTRYPFREYHTSKDSLDIIDEKYLEESLAIAKRIIFILENNCTMTRRFDGLIALSNPKYNLYQPTADPSIPDRKTVSDEQKKWNYLMDCLPRYFDSKTNLLDIADYHGLKFEDCLAYIKKFETKNLLTIQPYDWSQYPGTLPPFPK